MTTQLISPEIDFGAQSFRAEKFARQFSDILPQKAFTNLYPEGEDCYEDPGRAEEIRASYSSIDNQLRSCSAGELIVMVARRVEPSWPNGGLGPCSYNFKRVIALGELAGGQGLFYDFRGGQIVFPTDRFSALARHSLTAVTKHSQPEVHQSLLESKKLLGNQGLLPPKEDLLDAGLLTKITKQHQALKAAERYELFDPIGKVVIGSEEVHEFISHLQTSGDKTERKIFSHDFAALFGKLALENGLEQTPPQI